MNRAIVGAMRRGIAARKAGLPESACPYEDKRKPCGRLTFSRAFIRAWLDGYHNRLSATDREALAEVGQ